MIVGRFSHSDYQQGMERLQKSMTAYVKTLSKRSEGEDKEKILPVAYLGSSMINHGEDFENDSVFGQCLISTYDGLQRLQSTNRYPRSGQDERADWADSGDLRCKRDLKLA